MVLNLYIFSTVRNSNRGYGNGMADGYFTDVVIHSSKNYHLERAIQLWQLSVNVTVACGAMILRYHVYSILYMWLEQGKCWYMRLEGFFMLAGGCHGV